MPIEYYHLPSLQELMHLHGKVRQKKFGSQWLENWVKSNQQVYGTDIWGKPHWKKICNTDQSKCISIGHVSAHQKLKTPRQSGIRWLIIWLK